MTAIKLYRLAHKLYLKHIPVLPVLLYRLIYLINNCHVHYKTEIGEGTTIAYGGIGVVIHKDAVIGKNCVIESNVTIGGKSNNPNVPVIGDNVLIGSGACVLGDIHIGDNSVIGAGAVVVHDVPAGSVVAGVPAKVIRTDIDVDKASSLNNIIASHNK